MKKVYIKNKMGEIALEFEQPYVIEAGRIEKAMKDLFGIKIDDLADLFWEGNYANDCYKSLSFRDGNECWPDDICYSWDSKERCSARNAVRHFLDDYIPKNYPYEHIIVDITW